MNIHLLVWSQILRLLSFHLLFLFVLHQIFVPHQPYNHNMLLQRYRWVLSIEIHGLIQVLVLGTRKKTMFIYELKDFCYKYWKRSESYTVMSLRDEFFKSSWTDKMKRYEWKNPISKIRFVLLIQLKEEFWFHFPPSTTGQPPTNECIFFISCSPISSILAVFVHAIYKFFTKRNVLINRLQELN